MRIIKLLLITVAILSTLKSFSQLAGHIDTTFNSTDIGYGNGDGADSYVSTTSLQTDGKIIIGGNFTLYNGARINRITRLNTNGTIDSAFSVGIGANNIVYTSALQSDGKIIIGGTFTSYNGINRACIARLNADGTLDNSFIVGTGISGYGVLSCVIQSDGKIILGGLFTTYNGTPANNVVRLNNNGSIDNTFLTGTGTSAIVRTVSIQTDDKVIIGGNFTAYNGTTINRIARLNTNGTLDNTFAIGAGVDNNVRTSTIQQDGKIIIGGDFITFNGTAAVRIARINIDGTIDNAFLVGTGFVGANNQVTALCSQIDGKLIVSGSFTTYQGVASPTLTRLNNDATIDATFNILGVGPNNYNWGNSIVLQSDNKLILGGQFSFYNGIMVNYITRVNADGKVDVEFNKPTGANEIVYASALQSDGNIIIGGSFSAYNGHLLNHIARLKVDGTVDSTFLIGTGTDAIVYAIEIQNDGKILIGGNFTTYNGISCNGIARLNSDGTIDNTFTPGAATNGYVFSIKQQQDGKIIIGGSFSTYNNLARNNIVRLNMNGTIDNTFNIGSGATGGGVGVQSVLVQNDGKIIICGDFTNYKGSAVNSIARINTNGSIDAGFNVGSGANSTIYTAALQTNDNKIIIGGEFTLYDGSNANYIARLNTDGTLDNTFSLGGGANSSVRTIAMQYSGKILIGGTFNTYNGTTSNAIAQINSDGTYDGTFDIGTGVASIIGWTTTLYTMANQLDGKVIIGGNLISYDGTGRNRVARILGEGFCVPPLIIGTTPTTSCVSGAFTLNAVANAGIINWYADSISSISLGIGTAYTTPNINNTTTFYVDATDRTCISTRVAVIAEVNNVVVSANASADTVCSGAIITLYGSGASTYSWDNSVTNSVAFTVPVNTTTYIVTGTLNGCSDTASITISIGAAPIKPNICLVTLDDLGNNNIIVWEKTLYQMADTFYVYREITNNNYQIIGKVPYDSLSIFIDTVRTQYLPNTGDPRITSFKYKLAIKDTCGNLGQLSLFHKTIFLQDQLNGNFNWNHYEIEGQAIPVPQLVDYYFLRDNDYNGVFETIISNTASNAITDPSYFTYQNIADWRIETNWSIACDPTLRLANNGHDEIQTVVVRSKSNIRNNRTIGIKNNGVKTLHVKVYPNPASDILNVEVFMKNGEEAAIVVENMLGQVVYSAETTQPKTTINTSSFNTGVYFVKVKTAKGSSVEKVIVE